MATVIAFTMGNYPHQPAATSLFLNSVDLFFLWKLNMTSLKTSVLLRCLNVEVEALIKYTSFPSVPLFPCLWEAKDVLCYFWSF